MQTPAGIKNAMSAITHGVYVLGVHTPEKDNLMTAAWLCQVSSAPPTLAVAVSSKHLTTQLISQAGGFAVSVLSEEQRETALRNGRISGRVRYKRRKRIGDEKSPMVYALKLKSGEAKIYSIETLAREIESIGSLSVEDVSHVMKSFVRAMKKVLVAGDKVKVDGLGIFYTTLTCPGVEQEKDCTVKNISRVNLRFKVDNSLRLANDSTATTRGGENNVSFELYTEKKAASEGEGGGSGSEEPGKGEGGSGGGVTPDPSI